MSKYEAHTCESPSNGKWSISVDGIPDLSFGRFDTKEGAHAKASELECFDWIKKQLGQNVSPKPGMQYAGRICHAAPLHLVQRTGRVNSEDSFAIHLTSDLSLSRAPSKEDQLEVTIGKDGRITAKISQGIQR